MKVDINLVKGLKTPLYWYDKDLLEETIEAVKKCIKDKPVKIHYAVKANSNPEILKIISNSGFGADCVSGREIRSAISCGFLPENISYAGVGKTDNEILTGLTAKIGYFNVESFEELEVIRNLAKQQGLKADVALRVNPDIDAHTHHYITTGLEDNKFGINLSMLDRAVKFAHESSDLNLVGLHFHIGSQITITEPFKILCERINQLTKLYHEQGIDFKIINVGGGLGINYDDPEEDPIPDFKSYFDTLLDNLNLMPGQELHCELGRSIVGQCGSLISTVTFVKQSVSKKFVILDAAMNDLIRPALYGAYHKIQNLDAVEGHETEVYDVVGAICESSDVFASDEKLPVTKRGDIIAIRSAGAYGESMASTYNMRAIAQSVIR